MFGRMLQMDCRRCFQIWKVLLVICILTGLMLTHSIQYIPDAIKYNGYDIVSLLGRIIGFDKYKIIMAFALGALYCTDRIAIWFIYICL